MSLAKNLGGRVGVKKKFQGPKKFENFTADL
jgi:hypothetical protein